jgi:hypothetical protein
LRDSFDINGVDTSSDEYEYGGYAGIFTGFAGAVKGGLSYAGSKIQIMGDPKICLFF